MEYKSAVGIVEHQNRWLLGLAQGTGDDRDNRWVFPGGGIRRGETPEMAAVREVYEETGIRCRAISKAFAYKRPGVAFVLCKAVSGTPKPTKEMAANIFLTRKQMRSLKLYPNVVELLNMVR